MPLGLILIGKRLTVFGLEIGHNPIAEFSYAYSDNVVKQL